MGFGAREPAFDCCERCVASARYFGEFAAFYVAQHPGDARSTRQLSQAAIDRGEFCALFHVERRRCKFDETGVIHAVFEAESTQQFSPSKAAVHLVHGDAQQPRAEQRCVTQLGQARECDQERVLNDVFGLVRAAQEARGRGVHRADMREVQQFLGLLVSCPNARHQLEVARSRRGCADGDVSVFGAGLPHGQTSHGRG